MSVHLLYCHTHLKPLILIFNFYCMRKLSLTFIFLFIFSVIYAQNISPYLYGQNHWMANGDDDKRPGYIHLLWSQVEYSGVKLVRIGGNGYLKMPSLEKLDNMVDSIQSIGAEPLLQIPGTYTRKQTKDLVRHYNKSNRKPIKYWCIGNEPLHPQHNLTIEQVYDYIIEIAPSIKEVDPSVKVLVFDEAVMIDKDYETLCGGRLDITGKKVNNKWMIDGFTFHNYPNGRRFDRDDVVFSGPRKIERQMQALVKMMDYADKKHGRFNDERLIWGMTEVNVTYDNPDRDIRGFGNPSFLGGQFIAEIYSLGAKYGAFTVAPWCISETDRVHTDFGYIGAPEEFYPRSSYWHTYMMSKYINGQIVDSSSNQGYVKTVSSLKDDILSVLIMNEDNIRDYSFELTSNNISYSQLVIRLDTDIKLSYKNVIPKETSLVLLFDKSGKLLKTVSYSAENNINNDKPIVISN